MITDILIIGAGRSGTTTIFDYFKNHSQICSSKIKEVHFFSIDELFQRGVKYYHNLFEPKTNSKIFASADTYLFIANKNIIQRIFEYNPKMKFIVMLRNPVERAFSGYQYAINNGYLNKKVSFLESIFKEKNLLEQNLPISTQNNLCNAFQSKYYFHLKRWMSIFPQENFLILKTTELKNSPEKILSKISNFLKIDDFTASEFIISNSSKTVKSKKIEQILLNRDLIIRKLFRKIIPEKLKQKIFSSEIIDKIHKLNKSKNSTNKITDFERKEAQIYFSEDLQNLFTEFNIDLR